METQTADTKLQAASVAKLASLAGRPHHVECVYGWDRRKARFTFFFWRHGACLGTVLDPKRVVAKMEKLISCK